MDVAFYTQEIIVMVLLMFLSPVPGFVSHTTAARLIFNLSAARTCRPAAPSPLLRLLLLHRAILPVHKLCPVSRGLVYLTKN